MSKGVVGNRCPKCGGIAHTEGAGNLFRCTNGITRLQRVEGEMVAGYIEPCGTLFTVSKSKRVII